MRLEPAQIKMHKEIESTPAKEYEEEYDLDLRPRSVSLQSSEIQTWKRYLKQAFKAEQMSSYGDPQGISTAAGAFFICL